MSEIRSKNGKNLRFSTHDPSFNDLLDSQTTELISIERICCESIKIIA